MFLMFTEHWEWLWGRASNQRTFCLFTWTHLAALSIYFLRVLAGVSVGAVNFLTLLFGDITSTQHTLHNAKCPEVRVPGFTMRIGLSIRNTHWKRTQYWKLKVRELKWAPVLRTQALNPLRHQASLVLYMAMEIHLQGSLFQINTPWPLFYHQQLFRFFSSSLWMLTSAWLSISKCFLKCRNEWKQSSTCSGYLIRSLVEYSFNGCSFIGNIAQVHVLLGMKISPRDLPPREARCKNHCSSQWATPPPPPWILKQIHSQ